MQIVAIILTYNEEIHLERCLLNIKNFVNKIYVVDSYSSDKTKEIALEHNAIFLENKFVNHARQFNWALKQIDQYEDWILRIDADEVLSESLKKEIRKKLPNLDKSIKGIYLNRYIVFQGKQLNHGGIFPNKVLRIFKKGFGYYSDQWMDERLTIKGGTTFFKGKIIDHNLNPLQWWITKHNFYSNKEVLELLKNSYLSKKNNTFKNIYKNKNKFLTLKKVYLISPLFVRSILYFMYRYIFKFGFLDGYQGLCFHLLQGLWYRFLVDAKYRELMIRIKEQGKINSSIKDILGIDFNEE